MDDVQREAQSPRVQIDRESVKTLAIAVGVREAARQLGLSEDRVLQWSKRGGWFKTEVKLRPPTVTKNDVITVISPSDALANTLSERKSQSLLNLSKYTVEAGERAAGSDGDLKIAKSVKEVASIHSTVWPEQKESSDQYLHIGVLANQANFFQGANQEPTG